MAKTSHKSSEHHHKAASHHHAAGIDADQGSPLAALHPLSGPENDEAVGLKRVAQLRLRLRIDAATCAMSAAKCRNDDTLLPRLVARDSSDPAQPAPLLTILQFDQLNNSFAEAVGLWATQSVVHQVHSLAHPLK